MINLHGTVEQTSEWVFTHSEIQDLLNNSQYVEFLKSLISTHTIMFVGASVDNIAVYRHFEALKEIGLNDIGPHFWITDRRDAETDRWAEERDIQVIRYNSSHGHDELDELLDDLLTYIPEEKVAPPVLPDITIKTDHEVEELPDPNHLIQEGDTEFIRRLLNNHAAEILSEGTDEAYERFEHFLEEYDEAINRAWYTSTASGRNYLLGHRLKEVKADGAFGRVYLAENPEGEEVALKVLHQYVRNESAMLQSFRRGVRSMRILAEHNVDGIVQYKKASEIPAFVTMDWIDGPNLREAIQSKRIREWIDIIYIAYRLATIIKTAHSLPKRVLHRDIRPANIMLSSFDIETTWDVMVLDFDLSWHRGAQEESIQPGATSTGYLAPEQIQEDSQFSTRNAAVDSFGLGMTLFFMISGRDPVQSQHLHQDWIQTVRDEALNKPSSSWQSLPCRIARVVLNSTQNSQTKRWDLTQIHNELERLWQTVDSPHQLPPGDILAEELMARSEIGYEYTWDPDRQVLEYSPPTGFSIELFDNEVSQRIEMRIRWQHEGSKDVRRARKWINQAYENSKGILHSSGWKITNSRNDRSYVEIDCFKKIRNIFDNFDKARSTLDRVIQEYRYEW